MLAVLPRTHTYHLVLRLNSIDVGLYSLEGIDTGKIALYMYLYGVAEPVTTLSVEWNHHYCMLCLLTVALLL